MKHGLVFDDRWINNFGKSAKKENPILALYLWKTKKRVAMQMLINPNVKRSVLIVLKLNIINT